MVVQARGLLMIEHRLIERMIAVIGGALTQAKAAGTIDPSFVDAAVEFTRTYADRTHHGKEEDIQFKECAGKPLSAEDRLTMERLIEEHGRARRTTRALVEANTRYRGGDPEALPEVFARLQALVDFYPEHIELEDKVFFPAAREYFTDLEDQAMVEAFYEFDRQMIHERYRKLVQDLEERG
jgi:hemerythrin-like domain-containing protein